MRCPFANRFIIAFALTLFSASLTHAQLWDSVGGGVTGGDDADITAMTVYHGSLYVAGNFNYAGSVPALNIAKWDGSKWSAVGAGLLIDDFPEIKSMVVYKNALYVCGNFTKVGDQQAYGVAKWDDSTWSAVDTNWIFYKVNSLAVYKGLLYLAGEGLSDDKTLIATWDGSKLDTVKIDSGYNIYAMCVHDSELYCAGNYTDKKLPLVYCSKMPHWNGSKWNYDWMGSDTVAGKITTMLSYSGKLYAGGNCVVINHHDSVFLAANIAVWNDTIWNNVGDGLLARNSPYRRILHKNYVYSIAGYNGVLYAGGDFNTSGNDTLYGLAQWNGKKWLMVKKAMDGNEFDSYGMVFSMQEYNGWLYVAGIFDSAAGIKVNNIAKWHAQKTIRN